MMKRDYVDPHFHELSHQWELFQVLDGLVKITFYSNDGSVNKCLEISDNSNVKLI